MKADSRLRTARMANSRGVLLVVALAITLPTATATAQTKPSAPPDLDAYVTRVMKTFEVPGIALTIVKDGQVLVAKGVRGQETA